MMMKRRVRFFFMTKTWKAAREPPARGANRSVSLRRVVEQAAHGRARDFEHRLVGAADDERRVAHGRHGGDDAAGGDDLVAGLERANRLLQLLLALALRDDDQEVEDAEDRSEEHTSELQSRQYLVCRLLLEKKKPDRKITRLNSRHANISS